TLSGSRPRSRQRLRERQLRGQGVRQHGNHLSRSDLDAAGPQGSAENGLRDGGSAGSPGTAGAAGKPGTAGAAGAPRFGSGSDFSPARLEGRPSWLSSGSGPGDAGGFGCPAGTGPPAVFIGADSGGCGRLNDAVAVGTLAGGVAGAAAAG